MKKEFSNKTTSSRKIITSQNTKPKKRDFKNQQNSLYTIVWERSSCKIELIKHNLGAVSALFPSNWLNSKYCPSCRKLIRFLLRGAEEVELDDSTESFGKGSAAIIKESSRSRSASKGIESTKVLIPFHLRNTKVVSIAPQWESYFRTTEKEKKSRSARGRSSCYLRRGKLKGRLESRAMTTEWSLYTFKAMIFVKHRK